MQPLSCRLNISRLIWVMLEFRLLADVRLSAADVLTSHQVTWGHTRSHPAIIGNVAEIYDQQPSTICSFNIPDIRWVQSLRITVEPCQFFWDRQPVCISLTAGIGDCDNLLSLACCWKFSLTQLVMKMVWLSIVSLQRCEYERLALENGK
jgi:hypothetical protein